MKYKVMISDRAKDMLGMHIRFLAQINKPAAAKLKARLIEEIRSLQELPQRYPFFHGNYIPANKYHKLYVENCYLVLYQIKDDTVYVDWIVDCRQDYRWLLR
jgi:plasmid stabilization system protein ParE